MTRTSLLILFSFIALMCSNKKKVSINKFDEKFYEYLTHYYPTRPWKDEKGYLFRHRDLAPEQKLDGLMHVYEPPLQGYHVFHEDWNSMQLLWASRMLIGMVYLNESVSDNILLLGILNCICFCSK